MPRMKTAIVVTLAAALAAACDKAGGSRDGKERGPCYGNQTCDTGLSCMSGVCVRQPADCAKVGSKLASYRLGNYAPRDERDRVVAELTQRCEQERLSEAEGQCILDAQGRLAVARCPRPLLPELANVKDGCAVVGDTLANALVRDGAQELGISTADLEKLAPRVRALTEAACVDDDWPESSKECIASAGDVRALGKCIDALPRDLEDRFTDRLRPLLRELEPKPGTPPTVPAAKVAPDPGAGGAGLPVGLEACEAMLAAMERHARCPQTTDDERELTRKGIDDIRTAYLEMSTMPAESLQEVNAACETARAEMLEALLKAGCS
jgi:hypothetical protein